MPLPLYFLLLPLIRISCAWRIWKQIYGGLFPWNSRFGIWKRYRPLLPSLLVPAVLDVGDFITRRIGGGRTFWVIATPVLLLLWGWITWEVVAISCDRMDKVRTRHAIGAAVLCGCLGLQFVLRRLHLNPFQSLMVFRQYVLAGLFCALLGVLIVRLIYPAGENPDHVGFRVCMTIRAGACLFPAAFGYGGFAWSYLHWDTETWKMIDRVMWCVSAGLAILQAAWMTWSPSSRVPEWMKNPRKGCSMITIWTSTN